MTKFQKDSCLIMARSFIKEFIVENKLDKKKHRLVYELCDKLGAELRIIADNHKQLEAKAKASAEYVLDKLQGYVKQMGKTEVEANNLIFGLNFIFILVERNLFKGSKAMYYKRVSNELYSMAEAECSGVALHNANELVKRLDEDM